MEEEIEVNFRLDGEGRTALAAAKNPTVWMDYTTKACTTTAKQFDPNRIHPNGEDNCNNDWSYDDLLLDCEIADSGLMPRTFWVPAKSEDGEASSWTPRFHLEQMARDIFDHHTAPVVGQFDPATSGAEWWVQLRPSPERTGRYSMHAHSAVCDDDDENDENERSGITFHWDKDEDLRLLCGGTTYVHPHLSTVTYLTDWGAPTLVAEGFAIHNLTGEWRPQPTPSDAAAFISWPRRGKHLSFDGRFLHAAPADLQEPGAFVEQCKVPMAPNKKSIDEDQHHPNAREQKALVRRHRRCTFLVNIWLNYKPFNVEPFPDTMIDKMSGHCQAGSEEETERRKLPQNQQRWSLSFGDTDSTSIARVTVGSDVSSVTCSTDDSTQQEAQVACIHGDVPNLVQQFTWPIGDVDSGEFICATLPLSLIRAKATCGGNVRVRWEVDSCPTTGVMGCQTQVGMFLVKQDNVAIPTGTQSECKRPRLDGQ